MRYFKKTRQIIFCLFGKHSSKFSKEIISSLSIRKNWWLILVRFPQIPLLCWSGGCELEGLVWITHGFWRMVFFWFDGKFKLESNFELWFVPSLFDKQNLYFHFLYPLQSEFWSIYYLPIYQSVEFFCKNALNLSVMKSLKK